MAADKLKINFKFYDSKQLDYDIKKIISVVEKTGARIVGPINLPTRTKVFCVNRSPHVDKKSREQFHVCMHKRVVYILDPSPQVMNSLSNVEVSPGVDIKMV